MSPIIGKATIALYLLSTGFIRAEFSHMVRRAPAERVELPVLVAVIHHPKQGWGLFDTGFGEAIEEERSRWPEVIGRWFLPLEFGPSETAARQIRSLGIGPGDIRWIVLSHSHNDHSGGLRDFPSATLYVDSTEWDWRGRSRWEAVRRGQILAHFSKVTPRVMPLDLAAAPPYETFPHGFDLFGDGRLIILSTPGHTPGHLSLLIKSDKGPALSASTRLSTGSTEGMVLLTGDVAWTLENVKGPTPKGWLVSHLEEWNSRLQEESLRTIHEFGRRHPELTLVPSHDPHLWPSLPKLPSPLMGTSEKLRDP